MLASINPLGERARNQRWISTATALAVGSTGAGALLGLVLGSLGWTVRTALGGSWEPGAVGAVALVVCGLAGAWDATSTPLPSPRRQVDERWLDRYRGWVYGLGFGMQLGLGVVTIVSTATVYAGLALALLSGSPTSGLAIGAVFGLTRALPLAAVGRAHDSGTLRRIMRRLDAAAPLARRTTVAASTGAVVVGALMLGLGWA